MSSLALQRPRRSRDVRDGGRWTLAQRLKNGALYWIIRAALSLADRLPEGALCRVGRALGWIAWSMWAGARRIARRNVERALPDQDAGAIVRRSFVVAGQNLALSLLLRRPSRGLDRVVIHDATRAALEAAVASGSGAVVASAHFGPFELIAPAVSSLGLQTSVVVRQSYDARLDALVDRHRLAHRVGVIHRGRPEAAAALVRALRQQTLLGLLVDLPGRGTRRHGSLFGSDAGLAAGAMALGRRLKVPLLIGLLTPLTTGSDARFELTVAPVPAGDLGQAAIAHAIERAVVAWPEQWLWMGDPLGLAVLPTSGAPGAVNRA